MRVGLEAVEDAAVMNQYPVDVDLESTQCVVVAGLQIREGGVRHLREGRLPFRTRFIEIRQRGFAVHES